MSGEAGFTGVTFEYLDLRMEDEAAVHGLIAIAE